MAFQGGATIPPDAARTSIPLMKPATARTAWLLQSRPFAILFLIAGVSCRTHLGNPEVLRRLAVLKSAVQTYANGEYRYARPVSFPPDSLAAKNVVLFSLDTMRADRLNSYGYSRSITSPQIDRFSRQAVLFENCYIHSPGTLPSQMTLLTGYYPTAHGITYRRRQELEIEAQKANRPLSTPLWYSLPALSSKIATLAEILKVHGFHTIGFHEGGYLSAPLGYSFGFDRFVCTQSNRDDPKPLKQAEGIRKTAGAARAWLATASRPFFLFVHTYELHAPYIHDGRARALGLAKDSREYNSISYDDGIQYADRYVGELLALLDEAGLLANTVIVVTSDHGEEFGDHYPIWNMGHGESQYQEQIRVPLIIYEQGLVEAADHARRRRITEDVQSVDIVPTILELALGRERALRMLGAPELERSGRSLVALARGPQPAREVYTEDSIYGPERLALVRKGFKFVLKPSPDEIIIPYSDPAVAGEFLKTPPRELFDLHADPLEKHNAIRDHPAVAAEMEDEVRRIRRALEQQNTRLRGGAAQLDADTIRALRSLGYLGGR